MRPAYLGPRPPCCVCGRPSLPPPLSLKANIRPATCSGTCFEIHLQRVAKGAA